MIDTVILHIYNLEKYESICNLIAVDHRKEGATKYTGVTKEAFDAIRFKGGKRDVINFKDTNNYMLRSDRSPVYIASSTYRPVVYLNNESNPPRIEFNLSVPKFYFGCNLVQFISHYSQSSDATFDRFIEFIEHFRLTSFTQIIDREDICVNRIDFCYNQFFKDKDAVDDYFNALKAVFNRNAFAGGNLKQYKDETLMRHTEQYSFKVYKKGPEFKKNDYTKVCKLPNLPMKPGKMQEVADRVLRYEASYRSSFISDKWYWLYRDAPQDKRFKKGIEYLVLSLRMDENLYAKRHMMIESRYDHYNKVKEYYYRECGGDLEAARAWITEFKDDYLVTFNKQVFRLLYEDFWAKVKDHQVKGLGNIEDIRYRIRRMNAAAEGIGIKIQGRVINKIDETSIISWILQSREKSLKHFVHAGSLSKSRYYEIRDILKLLGLSDFNPELSMVTPDLDYGEYQYTIGNYFHR